MGLEDYKPVKVRIHEFRQAHPDWTIRTNIRLAEDGAHWISETLISDADGHLIANGWAYEQARKPFDMEKTETSSVGRALVFAGWTDSLELSREELERSEAVVGAKDRANPVPIPQQVVPAPTAPQGIPDKGPVTDATLKAQVIEKHPDPKPPGIDDLMRLSRPPASAPKGFHQEFVTELVAAAAHEKLSIPWRDLTRGKGFNELTTHELKELVVDVDKWLNEPEVEG